MKKALIVANLGGFAHFLLSDMDILQSLGYEVVYAANGRKHEWGVTKKELDKRGVQFIQIDFDSKNPFTKENCAAYKQIDDLLKKEKFDLVHCHTPISGLLTRLAARKYRKTGTKIMYTTHGFSFTSNSSRKSWLMFYTMEAVCSHFCDAIITINHEDYDNAKKMSCKNVFYIPGVGVDIAKFRDVEINRQEYRQNIGVHDDEIMVLSVGELSERKNHQIIIEALNRIKEDKKYVYVICGSGIDGGTGMLLRNLANEKNVSLRLLGFRMDIPEITKCSDIGAIPSIREGLGLAGIQSLAAGVPVVGTNVQGIRDYILDEKTGYLCQADDAEAFAKAISALSDPMKCSAMKGKCVNMAEQFDFAVSMEQRKNISGNIGLDAIRKEWKVCG